MAFSRRSFLSRTAAGVGTAALLQFPLASRLYASPEPARTPGPNGEILLNSNENPYGPLPSAMKSMQDTLNRANRYPDFQYRSLVSLIAAANKVSEDQVLLGAGSSEILRICAQAFTGPGKNAVVASPTFEFLGDFSKALGAEVRAVPLTSTYAHDLDGMAQRVDANTGVIYLCNANNPTASITPGGDISTFLNKLPGNAMVVLDEAYHHFSLGMPGYRSFMDAAGDRVIVLRTFSKIYGMAGMRLGYAVASVPTIAKMASFRLPIDVNTVVNSGGVASLQDDAAMKFASQRNAADREEFSKQAASRNITIIPSFANFVMVKTGKPVRQVMAGFQKQNVLIGRPFPPMLEWIRVSFGLPDEMQTFWKAWDTLQA